MLSSRQKYRETLVSLPYHTNIDVFLHFTVSFFPSVFALSGNKFCSLFSLCFLVVNHYRKSIISATEKFCIFLAFQKRLSPLVWLFISKVIVHVPVWGNQWERLREKEKENDQENNKWKWSFHSRESREKREKKAFIVNFNCWFVSKKYKCGSKSASFHDGKRRQSQCQRSFFFGWHFKTFFKPQSKYRRSFLVVVLWAQR